MYGKFSFFLRVAITNCHGHSVTRNFPYLYLIGHLIICRRFCLQDNISVLVIRQILGDPCSVLTDCYCIHQGISIPTQYFFIGLLIYPGFHHRATAVPLIDAKLCACHLSLQRRIVRLVLVIFFDFDLALGFPVIISYCQLV